ncbi:MAG: hypothetical protein ABJA57_10755 [Ginsengibacter sp.]
MKPRSKKYYESRKANQDSKKGSASKAGYDEQNEKTIKAPKENPAVPKKVSKKKVQASNEATAEQDDTGGENNSGKRSDDD